MTEVTPPFLADDEIAALCRPLRQPAAQARFLARLGITAQRRPDGTLLVWRRDASTSNQRAGNGGRAPNWTT